MVGAKKKALNRFAGLQADSSSEESDSVVVVDHKYEEEEFGFLKVDHEEFEDFIEVKAKSPAKVISGSDKTTSFVKVAETSQEGSPSDPSSSAADDQKNREKMSKSFFVPAYDDEDYMDHFNTKAKGHTGKHKHGWSYANQQRINAAAGKREAQKTARKSRH